MNKHILLIKSSCFMNVFYCIQDTLSSRARLAECVARAKVSCIQCFLVLAQHQVKSQFCHIVSDNSMSYRGYLSSTYVEHCQNTLCLADRLVYKIPYRRARASKGILHTTDRLKQFILYGKLVSYKQCSA